MKDASLRALVESRAFNTAITTVIVVNAVTLGLETSPAVMAAAGGLLSAIDRIALVLFTVELALKLRVYRGGFFRSGWNLFDLAIVALSWVPAAGPLSVLRSLRILRALRLVSVVPQMRAVLGALIGALPGMGSIVAVLILVFYVAAVMATELFGATFPIWFGNIGRSMYTLFQIMTLESWSMGIVRPVMEVHPKAWLFFVPFVVITSFAVLNLFIALIVNSMQAVTEQGRHETRAAVEQVHDDRDALLRELTAIRESLARLENEARGPQLVEPPSRGVG